MPVDFRVSAVRGDLADVQLADRVFAPHYAKSCPYSVVADTGLHAAASVNSDLVTSLRTGQQFDLLDISGGWAWGTCAGAVGYVAANTIMPL
ncbi:hypothetical protein BH09PSE3_BH09PSE3_05860 [soil metagenome]